MGLLLDAAYASAALAAAPLIALKSARTGKYRNDWPARLGHGPDLFPTRSPQSRLLLLHCVSVGELLSTRLLVKELLAADENLLLALSTTTDTGTARARELYPPAGALNHHPRIAAVRYPLDFSFAAEAFFDRVRPDAVALVELETWPNFLQIASSRRVPVVLINGRLTARSFKRYALVRPLTASMFRKVSWFGLQTHTIAERFLALGAPPDRISILPTLKYDAADINENIPGASALAKACGLTSPHLQLFVAGSTAPTEEVPLLAMYTALKQKHPHLRFAIAPRHPETLPQVLAAIHAHNLTPVQRTNHPDTPPKTQDSELRTQDSPSHRAALLPNEVLVLDTLGELKKLYSLAFAAFVGRSLVPAGGSDMIEVAALAKPCCFGPHTDNFEEPVELLLAHNAATRITDAPSLTATVDAWLSDPSIARRTGQSARTAILSQRGSTHTYTQKLLTLLPPR
jgi:3-deoxy-D-manno-octulosonic-acid transferase